MDDLINLGYAKSFTSALELVDLLAEKREAPKVNVEGIWKFNALDNIKTQLLLLMAGNS